MASRNTESVHLALTPEQKSFLVDMAQRTGHANVKAFLLAAAVAYAKLKGEIIG